jgi:TonB-linked SusC/RagA family outer membrane protein
MLFKAKNHHGTLIKKLLLLMTSNPVQWERSHRTNRKKILLAMKITTILLLSASLTASAAGFGQKVTLSVRNIKLEKVFKEIKKQTGYVFFYDANILKKIKPVSIDVKNGSVEEVLKESLEGKPLDFSIERKTITIVQKERHSSTKEALSSTLLSPLSPLFQEIKGTVKDGKGNPLAGVSVVVKGTTKGTSTNADGSFSIDANVGDVLELSIVGYNKKSVTIENNQNTTVVMEIEETAGSEIVVVGYGTQKKVNLTGAVSQIDAKSIADKPVANVAQAIQGSVPNLNITFADGHPGSGGKFNIRGYASLTNSGGSPLILVDGVPGDINMINPQDVESISVLKDAASSAIYGARGAFGVILVTTKQVKKGKLRINYTNNFSWQTPTTSTDFITDGYTAAKLVDSAFIRAVGTSYTGYNDEDYAELLKRQTDHSLPSVVVQNRNGKEQYVYYANTDWWHTMFRDWQPAMDHSLGLSGGGEKVDFMLSGRYYEQKGMYKVNQDQYNSYNFRAKITARITPSLTIYSNTQFAANDYSYPGYGYNSNFVSITVHALPSYVPINPDGTGTYRTNLNNYNIGDGIYATLLNGKAKGGTRNYDLTNTIGLNLNIAKGLTFTGNYTFDLQPYSDFQRRTMDPWSINPGVIQYLGTDYLNENLHLDQHHTINAYVTYENKWHSHNFKIMGGYNQELQKYKTNTTRGSNLLSDDLNNLDLATGQNMLATGNASEWALLGYFGRINYDYKGKYLLELDGRYDGTSRFPQKNRFGFFPSVSAGWRISEESFFNPLKNIISDLKFRGSYGSLGNQQLSNNYPYIPVMVSGSNNYIIDAAKTQYLSVPNPIDPNFTWEKSASIDGGVDIALFRNRFQASYDWYKRKTTDMITKGKTLPAVFGAAPPNQNAADLVTTGFDFTASWKDNSTVAGKSFSYNIGVVLSDYTARITKFDNPNNLLSDNYIGKQLGEIWGYSIDGYFLSDDEAKGWNVDQSFVNKQRLSAPGIYSKLMAGDLKFKDVNGDGVINNGKNTLADPGDLRRIGNSLPRYSFGITGGGAWNGIDVSIFLQGIGKQNWYPGNNADKFWGVYSRAYYSFIPVDLPGKIWSPENPNAYFPRIRSYEALNSGGELNAPTDKYLQDLAYIRLKNLTVGYSFPALLLKRIKIDQLRVYFSGANLFTVTKLDTKYIDPEQAGAEANGRVYPFFKTYAFGLNLGF